MAVRTSTATIYNLLGNGLITPFARQAGSDFLVAAGPTLVTSAIRQILGTRPGEVPWRPEFGTDLERYRHRPASQVTSDAIAKEIIESLARWEPRVTLSSCEGTPKDAVIYVKLIWVAKFDATQGNNVLLGPMTEQLEV